jgi:hypothetical protein
MSLQLSRFWDIPLQFVYSEICHYNFFLSSDLPFCMYWILLDPSLIPLRHEKTKMPFHILSDILSSLFSTTDMHVGLTWQHYLWPHLSSPLISLPLLLKSRTATDEVWPTPDGAHQHGDGVVGRCRKPSIPRRHVPARRRRWRPRRA